MCEYKAEKSKLVAYLGQGILPFEQWSSVFSNNDLQGMPGLISKAFTVWFPTMIDYLNRPNDIVDIINLFNQREIASEAISLCNELEHRYKNILSMYSREEQIFIYDRRIQNVHGVLSIFRIERIRTKYYNSANEEIVVEHLLSEDYHEIVRPYYSQMNINEINLRNKLTETQLFKDFCEFYVSRLKIDPHIIRIAGELVGNNVDRGY